MFTCHFLQWNLQREDDLKDPYEARLAQIKAAQEARSKPVAELNGDATEEADPNRGAQGEVLNEDKPVANLVIATIDEQLKAGDGSVPSWF